MSNARLKRRIAGLISKGLLDPDWRSKYRTRIPSRRPELGFFAKLWQRLRGVVTRKPKFRSQEIPKDQRENLKILGQRAALMSTARPEVRGQDR